MKNSPPKIQPETQAEIENTVHAAMAERCKEQGHAWKIPLHISEDGSLECKWCGFRV